MQTIIFFLICMSLLFTFLGGATDIIQNSKKDKDNNKKDTNSITISKEHYWNDGVYLLLLASFLQIYLNNLNNK